MTSPTSKSKQPMNWEDYEYGRSTRQGSSASHGSHVQFHPSATPPVGPTNLAVPKQRDSQEQTIASLRHRGSRSSISSKINNIAQAGGANSFENFARSWSRAAVFPEIPQRRPSFALSENDEETLGSKRSEQYPSPAEARSLLRQQFDSSQEASNEEAVADGPSAFKEDEDSQLSTSLPQSSIPEGGTLLDASNSSPFAHDAGSRYGSIQSRGRTSATKPLVQRRSEGIEERKSSIDEEEPLRIKVVEQRDGKKIHVVVGRSTLPQTVFNSVNTLIGIGILSLPLAFKQSGFLIGMVFLLFAAFTTRYTARLLAKCLDVDMSLMTFSDVAWKAFGMKARIAVGLLFTVELLAACLALVILFADSLDVLIPGLSVTEWKILSGLVLIPLSLLPLRFLSFTSVLGILSCLGIVALVFADGFIKNHAPGSLREPASTFLFPNRWSDVPLGFGLLMAPWGGHGVFPNIYRDMRHPQRYSKAVDYTYIYTYIIDVSIAIAGYLMFGEVVRDEVTSNILKNSRYPHALSVCIVVCIAIIPLTKVPLNARPIFVVIEDICGLHSHKTIRSLTSGRKKIARSIARVLIRTLTIVVIVSLAILIPSFESVMGLMGAALAFGICIILPVAFHLKLFHGELKKMEVIFNWVLIIVCSCLALISTIWVFLPTRIRESFDDIM